MINNIHKIIEICNRILLISWVIFPLTTAYMLLIIRLHGENPIFIFSNSKLSISFDLKLFGYMRQRYIEIKKGRLIPFLNQISWYVGIATYVIYFFLVVLAQLS